MTQIRSFIIIGAACAFLCGNAFATEPQCNDGSTSSTVPGIPASSCWLSTSSIVPSINISATAGSFNFDIGDIRQTVNGQERIIRLTIASSDASYRDVQALIQTGYATRSTFNVIYPNPARTSSGCTTLNIGEGTSATYI